MRNSVRGNSYTEEGNEVPPGMCLKTNRRPRSHPGETHGAAVHRHSLDRLNMIDDYLKIKKFNRNKINKKQTGVEHTRKEPWFKPLECQVLCRWSVLCVQLHK